MEQIKVYNLSGMPVADLNEFKELQEDFKIYDESKNEKLQKLIIQRGFKYAFKAWQDESGQLWIIDAHQRRKALISLQEKGYEIPSIPYELIYAENKRDAVKEIAAYNSEFASKNPDTVLFEKYDITTNELSDFNLDFVQHDISISDDDVNWDEMRGYEESNTEHSPEYRIKYEIIFDHEGQQDKWYEFIKNLKHSYPDKNTIAERIIQFIEDNE